MNLFFSIIASNPRPPRSHQSFKNGSDQMHQKSRTRWCQQRTLDGFWQTLEICGAHENRTCNANIQ